MMRVGTPHYNFDSTNAQEPFTYMARIIGTNEIAVGYVVVAKATYCPKNTWKYYIEYNDYRSYRSLMNSKKRKKEQFTRWKQISRLFLYMRE